jgi:hypothetical protein
VLCHASPRPALLAYPGAARAAAKTRTT